MATLGEAAELVIMRKPFGLIPRWGVKTGRFPPIYLHRGVYTDWYTASQILSLRELLMLCALNTISRTPSVRKLQHMDQRQRSNQNPLDLVQTDGIAGAVIQLGRARRLVVRDLLRVFNCTTVL